MGHTVQIAEEQQGQEQQHIDQQSYNPTGALALFYHNSNVLSGGNGADAIGVNQHICHFFDTLLGVFQGKANITAAESPFKFAGTASSSNYLASGLLQQHFLGLFQIT